MWSIESHSWSILAAFTGRVIGSLHRLPLTTVHNMLVHSFNAFTQCIVCGVLSQFREVLRGEMDDEVVCRARGLFSTKIESGYLFD